MVPQDPVEAFTAARALADRHTPTLDQAVLADFITERHFERHMHRMRSLYAERQMALIEHAQRNLAGVLEVQPVSAYTWGSPVRPGLVLGYAAFTVEQIQEGVQRLAHALLPE